MALSDYLTGDEWDACWYFYCGKGGNFGESMHSTIDAMLAKGYRFRGLDERGAKDHQISSNNPSKVLIFLGNPHNVDIMALLENGRRFVKENAPDLLEETDEEWAEQLIAAKSEGK